MNPPKDGNYHTQHLSNFKSHFKEPHKTTQNLKAIYKKLCSFSCQELNPFAKANF